MKGRSQAKARRRTRQDRPRRNVPAPDESSICTVQNTILAAAIVAITVAAYIPAMKGEPVWDDTKFLADNPKYPVGQFIQARHGLSRIWFSGQLPNYWPVTYSTFWLEWQLWGRNTFGYHVVNILLHAFASVLFWRVLRRLKIPGAPLAGLIFAVHPACVVSVAWIIELKNTLSMVFYLLTILAYLRHERVGSGGSYTLALFVYAVTLLCKTSVVMLPVIMLGLAWWQRGRIARKDLLRTIPLFAVSMGAALISLSYEAARVPSDWAELHPGPFVARLANAGWIVWFYLYKAVVPLKISMIYEKWPVDTANVVFWLPAMALVACLAVLWWFRGRPYVRPILLAAGYFVVMLFPVVGFFDMSYMAHSWVGDQFQYVAILGVIALVAGGVGRLAAAIPNLGRKVVWAAAGAMVAVLAVLTWRQASVFQTEEKVWEDTIAKSKTAATAHLDLGAIYGRRGENIKAVEQYGLAIQARPNYAMAHYTLGIILRKLDRTAEAMESYRMAIRAMPDHALAHHNLGILLAWGNEFDEALKHLHRAIELDQSLDSAYQCLAVIYASKGEHAKAAEYRAKASKLRRRLPPGR